MKLTLPKFKPSKRERQWVAGEIETARFVSALWSAANTRKRHDPKFVSLLVCCGWTNILADDAGWESTRIWRNQHIADYLGVTYDSDQQLTTDLARVFPRLHEPGALLAMHTGITHYYKSLRPGTLEFVERHAKKISTAFTVASSTKLKPAEKIRRAIDLISDLGQIRIRGREVSPLNGLTPTLACLDPHRRLPIMNDKTRRLLNAIGQIRDSAGALALHKLIGLNGIRNSFDLDVYAATQDFPTFRKPRALTNRADKLRDVGLKSEATSIAHIATNRVKITKMHNKLTNLLRECLLWRQVTPKESRFDALILDWKKGRHLLIEAKTASAGPNGRAQLRQAIGQLFDYRFTYASHFPPGKVDLAVLLPSKPSDDVQSLLRSLRIELLWFEHRKLEGTVDV